MEDRLHAPRLSRIALVACLALPAIPGCGTPAPVRIERAWVRAADSAATTAAYFTLVNDGADSLHVTGLSGDVADAIAMHETVREGGMASMRETDLVDVAPRSRVAFEPGGRHVMLVGLRHRLLPGLPVNLTLHTSDGRELPVVAEVRP
jgi:copper(I)-binding protein